VTTARNDLNTPVPKFCLVLEASRRTPEGRVRTAHELVVHFFPHTPESATDRLFHFLPTEVRGPILTGWGVRGQKSALRDSDDKVRAVVHDALVAGDVDAKMFEDSIAPEVVVRWVDLPDWWTFWRGGKLAKYSILKALETGYELELFDAEWFLRTIASKDGKLRGTDMLAQGLSKADLTEWVRAISGTADGSARGIVAALGWDQIVSKTQDDVLIAVLDAIASKVGLKEESKKKLDVSSAPQVAAAASPSSPEVSAPQAQTAPSGAEPTAAAAPDAPAPASLRPAVVSIGRPPTEPAKDASRPPGPDAKALPRTLSPILFPSTPRKSDPSIDAALSARVAAVAAAAMAALPPIDSGPVAREAAPAPEAKAPAAVEPKDDEIPISADAFDDLGQTPTTPPAPEGEPKKRPSKAPRGAKAG
jgi:hypothetical protein